MYCTCLLGAISLSEEARRDGLLSIVNVQARKMCLVHNCGCRCAPLFSMLMFTTVVRAKPRSHVTLES